jgi:nucleoside 2-deoxyribosyltransferase
MLDNLTQEQKCLLTTWIVDQKRLGNAVPQVTSDVVNNQLPTMRPLRAAAKRDRLLFYVQGNTRRIGVGLKIDAKQTAARRRVIGELMAWTECLEENELWYFVTFCEEQGVLKSFGLQQLMLTPKGFEILEEMDRGQATSQAFVAMWFDDSLKAAYDEGFRKAIVDSGYKPMRIDRKEHLNKIDDEIIAEIRRSRFVVADFTCEPDKARGGVYFEAGFARGQGIPVVWTCRKDSLESVHFDTRQFNHIVWESVEDLYTQLKNRIEAVIGEGPLKHA